MRYPELVIQIRQGHLQPVYFFNGEEGFLIEEAVEKLKKAILTPGFEDLNYHLLSGPSADPAEIIHLCQTLPFLSSEPLPHPHEPPHKMRRLVVVREAEALSGSEALIPYLDNPSSRCCLVLVAGKMDQKKRLFLTLKAKGAEVHFSPLNDSQIKIWIKEVTRSMGITLSPEAVAYLQERLGNDLYQIRNELERISLTTGPGALEAEDIQPLLTGERSHSVFEWLDALRRRDHEKAIRLLNSLMDSGEYPLSLLGLLLSHLRRTARAGAGPAQGSCDPNLIRAFTLCLEADSRLKGSRLSPQLILEDLILNLFGKGNRWGVEVGPGSSRILGGWTDLSP